MVGSCSCLKFCSLFVAIANIVLGFYILVIGIFTVQNYVTAEEITIGLIVVYFQISLYLLFAGFLLLIGVLKANEKHISLYLLLSSLIWFIITLLALSYMLFYNTTTTQQNIQDVINGTIRAGTPGGPPRKAVPMDKAVGFSTGLVLIWCGQLCVYKFHDQVIEKIVINTGESYLNGAVILYQSNNNYELLSFISALFLLFLGGLLVLGLRQRSSTILLCFLNMQVVVLIFYSIKLMSILKNSGPNFEIIISLFGFTVIWMLMYAVFLVYQDLKKSEDLPEKDSNCDTDTNRDNQDINEDSAHVV